MNQNLSFGQRVDDSVGLVECWFTHGALDWIKQQNWSDKSVLMFGAGMGDAWLAKRCRQLFVVERNLDWLNRAQQYSDANNGGVYYEFRPYNDCSGNAEPYCEIPEGCIPDVIINDDAYRYEVCVMAEKRFKQNGGGILITDNWQQSYVFMCPAAEELLKGYESLIFEQADHTDNDGVNKWKTAIFFIK